MALRRRGWKHHRLRSVLPLRPAPVFVVLCTTMLVACGGKPELPLYEAVPVARRDLVVSAIAAGQLEPVLTVDVKSKASGEIIDMRVETGADVDPGQLLASIDPRQPRNQLAQAEANLEVAQAQRENAEAQLQRSQKLFQLEGIPETEYEAAKLAAANAKAAVVRAEVELETARDQMDDTQVRAPLHGTVLQKNVELGTVISSPTRDVGGGTVLFRMANLDSVQVRSLVDETDIGKVRPGLEATITVDAYPNRPFRGRVLKIEPQATVLQNVTMFPVLVGLLNPEHLLMPGMNCEVEIHVGERHGVLAIPNAALRTQRDVASAAQVLGLDPEEVQQALAAATETQPAPAESSVAKESASPAGATPAGATPDAAGKGETFRLPDGREITLPPGVTAEAVRAAFQKRMAGQELAPAERVMMQQVFGAMRRGGGRGGAGGGRGGSGWSGQERSSDFGGSYIVFTLRAGKPEPTRIKTGLTDLDHIEVTEGLAEADTVLVLPSASLLQSQREFRERFQRMTGGGLPGVQQQQQQAPRGGGGQPQRGAP